jgi:DNA-binding NarL/FixJ family response regulator
VRHWSVKVQLDGIRRTWSLQGATREAAAREALERYQQALQPASTARSAPLRALAIDPIPGSVPKPKPQRPKLVQRAHLPPGVGPGLYSLLHEGPDGPVYFPLGTADLALAQRRAGRIQEDLGQSGPAAHLRHPTERTLALEWCDNPVLWTYLTVHTVPEARATQRPTMESRATPGDLTAAVVEPDPGLRRALVSLLHLQKGVHCTRGHAGGSDALEALVNDPVALVLVNHALDGLSGPGFLDRLQVLVPTTTGLTYSVYDDSHRLFAQTPGGSTAYLLKRTPADRCLEPLLDPSPGSPPPLDVARRALAWFQRNLGTPTATATGGDLSRLTPRELEILALMSKGFLDKEIAQSLQISVWTVHGHAKRIYEKLQVHSRTEAAVKYLQK